MAHGPENSVVYNIGAIKKEALPKIMGSDVVSGNGPRGNASTSSVSTSPGNVKAKFPLKESVEETKDLIAVHKLNSVENTKFSINGSERQADLVQLQNENDLLRQQVDY